MEEMTIEEATRFFAEFYRGEHHIPGYKPKPFGKGWCVNHDQGDLATFDFNGLTRLVLMAHRDCIRVGVMVMPHRTGSIKISIHKRKRDGSMSERHPTLEEAIEQFNNSLKNG